VADHRPLGHAVRAEAGGAITVAPARRGAVEATLDHRTVDAERCRRLAQTLRLDAVGVLHRDGDGRSLAWWSAPGAPALPLDVETIVDGRADGWIVAPAAGGDVVVGRLTDRSSPGSLTALRSLLVDTTDTGTIDDPLGDPLDAERARWAYAIHDGLTQVVTSAVLDLEWRVRQLDGDETDTSRVLAEAAAQLREALGEIRAILAVVTPDVEGDADDATSLDQVVRQVSERWHIPASWSVEGDLGNVPTPVLDAAGSVIRESVANAAKHASARRISVHVEARPTEMQVSVEDAGRGFRPQEAGSTSGHLGLSMMRRRVEELHGTLDIQSEPGRGTRVIARLPVGEGETP
jgi:Histidine kinase-, DNA gyrase B-, and HSP90-like ATPase/Histidine kinase